MINVEIHNTTSNRLTGWESATAPYVKGDVIILSPDSGQPQEMKIIERRWTGPDQLVLIVTLEPLQRFA